MLLKFFKTLVRAPLLHVALTTLLGVTSLHAQAWSDHASLLWVLLRDDARLTQATLRVESLESFINAEREGLAELLDEQERRSRAVSESYAPRPEELAFRADADDPRAALLAALRVNPELPYRPFVRLGLATPTPGGAEEDNAGLLGWEDLSFLPPGTSTLHTRYRALREDERVSAAQVVATANDEPDLGMDVGLFSDNGTRFGALYGFGEQPFGNANLPYGSQAPFHMGFYHLGWLWETLQPGLLATYPAWRVDLFGALAEYAFRTGHAYWGWRFAGWALHYIGDLTQPYHADPLPGVSTLEAVWYQLRGKTADAVQLVSNRHGVIESYQYLRLRSALDGGEGTSLLQAMARESAVSWSERTLIDALTSESVAAGERLNDGLLATMPPRYVDDPGFEWIDSGEEERLVATIRDNGGPQALSRLDALLAEQLRRFARYAGAWLAAMMALEDAASPARPIDRGLLGARRTHSEIASED